MGVVGPAQFVVAVNNRIVTFTKAGVADGVLNISTNAFFVSVRNGSGTSDPRIRYDRLSGRWFIIIINVPTPNRVLIAWSDAASAGVITPATVWSFAFFNESAGASCFEDYPTLGIDNNALYIGANTFCGAPGLESYTGASGYVLPKASLLAGSGTVTRFALVPSANSAGPFTPQGVDNYDPSSNEGYFIGVDNATFGTLVLRRVSNPATTTPTISANVNITVPATSPPYAIPHLGNTGGAIGNLDGLDDRLYAAHMRNGRLWTAHNIEMTSSGIATEFAPPTGRVGVRWYELSGIRTSDGAPAVVQSGSLFDSVADGTTARHFWVPSIIVAGQQHAALGFSTAGTNFAADAATAGRWAGDALGTLQPFSLYTSSTTAYNPPNNTGASDGHRRWGDYSSTSVDPLDGMTMWTIQEFCNDTNSFGVRAVKLIAPPPALPSVAVPIAISTGVASTTVTISGSVISGSGFFDPGPNLSPPALPYSHITAAASGGVVVNSVTYVNPTTVRLDLNTIGVPIGPVNITITNPDGQSATGLGVLAIAPGVPTIVAEATSSSSVKVSWNVVTGASGYEVFRSPKIGDMFTSIGTTSLTKLVDGGRTPDTTYLYEVRALAGVNPGTLSAMDIATTTVFDDDPLPLNVTIKAAHIEQLRNAVNAVRVAAGLGPASFTDPGPSLAGSIARSLHITELRSALADARALLALPAVSYANSAASGTIIRSADIAQLRDGTR